MRRRATLRRGIRIVAVCAVTTLAVACKAQVSATVPLSLLFDTKSGVNQAALTIEVAACSDYQNKDEPSRSLAEVIDTIPRLYPGAKYEGCTRDGLDSYAFFVIPVGIDADQDGKTQEPKLFNLVSTGPGVLGIQVGEELSRAIDAESQRSMTSIDRVDVEFTIVNDFSDDARIAVQAVYVDDTPFVAGHFILKSGEQAVIRASDVSADYARKSGRSSILFQASPAKNSE